MPLPTVIILVLLAVLLGVLFTCAVLDHNTLKYHRKLLTRRDAPKFFRKKGDNPFERSYIEILDYQDGFILFRILSPMNSTEPGVVRFFCGHSRSAPLSYLKNYIPANQEEVVTLSDESNLVQLG